MTPGYGPAIHHALSCSDAVTTVSEFLRQETRRVLGFEGPLEMIHNFFKPRPLTRRPEEIRAELGLNGEVVVLHSSNLRPLKRIDLLLQSVARIRAREQFKLVILAGSSFAPFVAEVKALKLEERVVVRENVIGIEDYLQVADLGFFTSESESFCLSILEAMCFGVPSVARRVGGIPEVVQDDVSGRLVDSAQPEALAGALEGLINSPQERARLGAAARERARQHFSAEAILPRYEALYRRVCAVPVDSPVVSLGI